MPLEAIEHIVIWEGNYISDIITIGTDHAFLYGLFVENIQAFSRFPAHQYPQKGPPNRFFPAELREF
jgi:hypothetical protein